MPSAEKSSSAIWQACRARTSPKPIHGRLSRVVESQEQVATSQLVNGNLERQAVLENLIEPSKPARVPGTDHLDYLLATPWRYPPLKYGSRFGARHEPSLFYGGLNNNTTLAECAYYRWVFLFDMSEPPNRLSSRHTLFEANYNTSQGFRLQQIPFSEYQFELSNPEHYATTQALGQAFRAQGVEAFEYPSARDPNKGLNVALIQPTALASTHIENPTQWQCDTTHNKVTFSRRSQPPLVQAFTINDFTLSNGRFPKPA